jgi:CRP-like cAMP-binding protein
MNQAIESLARVPIFSGLTTEALAALGAKAGRATFHLGDTIIREGDDDRRLFVVVSGAVEVIKGRDSGNERSLAMFGPGDFFGEMALIDGLLRSATVIAREDTELLSLDQEDLRAAMAKHPSIALELLRELSRRIRALEKVLCHTLGGLVPICMACKNIRIETGEWVKIEDYITDRSEADFTHGICPDCMRRLYPKHFKDG